MKGDFEKNLLAKGYRLINGEWFAPHRVALATGHKPDTSHEPVAKTKGAIADPVRRFVRVKSYRCRLLDRDAVWVKYIIDALRYAAVLHSDETQWLEIQVEQEKITDRRFERTELTII